MGVRVAPLLRRAVLGHEAERLVPGWRPVAIVAALTALYVLGSLAFAGRDVSVSFAIIPVVLASVFLAPIPAALIIAVTGLTVLTAELALGGQDVLSQVELTELVAFAAVGVGLRVAVSRASRDRATLARQAAELTLVQAQAVASRADAESAREATEGWVRQLEVVQRAAARMTGRPSIRAVAEAIIDETRTIVAYQDCRVYLLEGDDLLPITSAGRTGGYERIDPEALRVKVGEGFSGWVARHGTPLLVGDSNADPRGLDIPGTESFDESLLVVPMRYEERVVGVIALARLGINQFTEAHLRLLMIIADHAATALELARQLQRSQELATELRRIVEMGSALSQSLDTRRIADIIARHVAGAVGADACAISYWDRPGDRLFTWGYWPEQPIADEVETVALAGYPATRLVLDSCAAMELDADDPAADPAEAELLRRDGHRGLVMIPLVAKGEAIGLIELFARHPFGLDGRRLELARAMANEAAMALANGRLYETARGLADRDPLTGFFNHRYLQERLAEEILRAQRSREPLSILMIDLDDFKLVNDTLGHLFGDEVLAWVGERIRGALRGSDVAARYGGDEFAIILPSTAAGGARLVGDRILAALDQAPFKAPGRGPVPVGASIGIAAFPADGQTARELLATADARLYRVKRTGGGAIEARVGRRHPTRAIPRALQAAGSGRGTGDPA